MILDICIGLVAKGGRVNVNRGFGLCEPVCWRRCLCQLLPSSIVQKEPAMLGTLPLGSSVAGALTLVVSARKHMGRHIEQLPGKLAGPYLTFEDTQPHSVPLWPLLTAQSHCGVQAHCPTWSLSQAEGSIQKIQ